MQKIKLINYTPEALRTMYTACRTCYSEIDPIDIWESEFSEMEKLVLKVLNSGHLTIAEHINFTFAISGVSRALTHQLVRHRHATYSQQSHRYVEFGQQFEYVIPDSINQGNPLSQHEYEALMRDANALYNNLVEQGIPAEDARFILPNACTTNIVMTCNLRELMHICNLRLCLQAQWEIRAMVEKMKDEVLRVYPFMKVLLVPNCKHCTDHRPCERRK